MLVLLRHPDDAPRVASELQALGLWTEPLRSGDGTCALSVRPDSTAVDRRRIEQVEGVRAVWLPPSSHPLLDELTGKPVAIGRFRIGPGERPILAAGPCSAESPEQVQAAARMASEAGACLLRGGAFKPRTSPYSFRGHGREALRWLRDAADGHGLALVTEVMSEGDVEAVAELADLLQVGSRNMQAFALLRAVGRMKKPVLLKRGMAATVEEWLASAEHLLLAGATSVILCERGLRSFDPSTRNLIDLGAVALLAHVHRLPVIVDPSHATGRRDLVDPLARAALAAGAHGVIVECHPDPGEARSDGPQAIDGATLARIGRAVAAEEKR